MALLQRAYLIELGDEFAQRRKIEIAFEQGRARAETRIGAIEQLPDRIDHGGAVRVDLEAGLLVVMTGDVVVGDAFAGIASRKAFAS